MILTNDSTKIGIARLLTIIGIEENYKEIVEINGYNYNYCSNTGCGMCGLIQSLNDEQQKNIIINNTCMRKCPYLNKKIKFYKNEKNDYKIKKILLLSKSQLQQYVYYHNQCDSSGGVFNLSAKSVAKELGYTVRTIKKNNDFFVDNNLICLGKMGADCFSLFISGYKDYFKTKKEYGRGYLNLSREVVIKLLKDRNISNIRFTLRELIEYSRLNRSYSCDSVYVEQTYTELKRILPSYINCPKKINNFIKSSKIDIFDIEFTGSGIKSRLKDQYNNNIIRHVENENYKVAIINYINRKARRLGYDLIGEPINDIFSITNIFEYIDDFVQMTKQYDAKLVFNALDYLLELIIKNNFNGNCGAVVRNRIRDIIYGQAISV